MTEHNGQWQCDKCDRSYPAPSPRFILSLMVCDATSSAWLTAFDDAAKVLLGGTTAGEMNSMLEQGMKDQGTNTHAQQTRL